MTKKIRLAWFRWWMKPIYTNIPRSNFESVRPSSKLLQSLRRFSNKTRLMSISNASIRFKTGHNCEVSLSSFFWRFQPNFSGFIFAKEKTEMKRGKMAKNVSARFFYPKGKLGLARKRGKHISSGSKWGKFSAINQLPRINFLFPLSFCTISLSPKRTISTQKVRYNHIGTVITKRTAAIT